MKTTSAFTVSVVCAAATAAFSMKALAAEITGRVISSTPVVEQVAVPRQVCTGQTVTTEAPRSGAGFALGALAGGAAGNAIGNGSGRAVATFIGLVGGGLLGNQIEGSRQQTQNVQQCSTQTFYENRATYYNVVYDYQGTQYTVQLPLDPGPFIKLQVTPVGVIQNQQNPQTQLIRPQVSVQPQEQIVQPQPYQPITVTPMYAQQQQPVFLAPVVVHSSSTYYGQPYYAPDYHQRVVPNVSLNFGYSRGNGWGNGHGHRQGYRY